MSGHQGKPTRVGIRELRQNLSVYVRRVREDGQAYEVTERGEAVAQLTPLPGRPRTQADRMLEAGRIAPARRDLADLPVPIASRGGKALSQVVLEMRDEETR